LGRPTKALTAYQRQEKDGAMKRHRTRILAGAAGIATVGALIGAALTAPPAQATPSSGVTTTILGKSRFDEIHVKAHADQAEFWKAQIKTRGRSDVYVVDNKFTPGATTGWHSHPGPSLILVVAGTVTNYDGDDPSCAPHVYTAGTGFIDPGGRDVHMLRNETTAPAETIAVQLLPSSTDRRIDTPAANCSS
jgi:quercetin dioxygenase-like cupin family protein